MESHVTALGLQDRGRGRGREHLGCRVPSVRWMGRLSKLWVPEKSLRGPQADSRSGFLEPVLCVQRSEMRALALISEPLGMGSVACRREAGKAGSSGVLTDAGFCRSYMKPVAGPGAGRKPFSPVPGVSTGQHSRPSPLSWARMWASATWALGTSALGLSVHCSRHWCLSLQVAPGWPAFPPQPSGPQLLGSPCPTGAPPHAAVGAWLGVGTRGLCSVGQGHVGPALQVSPPSCTYIVPRS